MEQKTSLWKSSMVYCVYLAIFFIVVSIIFYVLDMSLNPIAQYVSYASMLVAVIYVQVNYKKALGGYMTYGQGVGVATVSMLLAGIIVGIYTYLLFTVIDPGLVDQLRVMTEEKMLQQGIPEEQMEVAVNMASKFQSPLVMSIMSPFSYAIIGLVISLITSIFTKNVLKEEDLTTEE